jgi:hypothetical protein
VTAVLGALATAAGTFALRRHLATDRVLLAHDIDGSALRTWGNSLQLGVILFSPGALAVALLAWRALARGRPDAANLAALPGVLGAWWIFGAGALVFGGRRPIPDLLFVVLYWVGGMGIVPTAIFVVLFVEALLRQRAAARTQAEPR